VPARPAQMHGAGSGDSLHEPTRFDVVVVGSANLDLVARSPRHPAPGETVLGTGYAEHPGGKGLNQAVAAARSGARTAMVAAVGTDAAGRDLLEVAIADGIDARWIAQLDGATTGRALIVVDDRGENSIVVIPGANAQLRAPESLPAAIVVLAQLEVPIATVTEAFRMARAAGATTVLNPAPAQHLPAALLEVCDIVVPNEHEVELLGGVEHLLAHGVRAVVVTLGADGADVMRPSGRRHQEPFAVEPVDTTGAGDAFCGAFAARLAAGESIERAVEWAAAAGALATTSFGAVPSLPTAEAVSAVLSAAAPQRSSPRG
jgi:ribokinase